MSGARKKVRFAWKLGKSGQKNWLLIIHASQPDGTLLNLIILIIIIIIIIIIIMILLNIVLKMTKEAVEDIGLQWSPKKCNVLNVRRGVPVDLPEGFKSGETLIDSLKENTNYRFLGAPERLLQEEKLTLQCTSKTYLQRLSVIWSSPLSDTNRVQASNQLAMPVLSYLTWSQHWCLTDLRDIDRQARQIVCESGKHPLGLKATVYTCQGLWEDVEWNR